jgi:hypothetical protein
LLSFYRRLFCPVRPEASEERLLLLLLRVELDSAAQDAARALIRAGIDWDRLLNLAAAHRVSALAYIRIQACFADVTPTETLAALERVYQAQRWDNLNMTSQMTKLVGAMDGAGIAALPLKGPAVALSLYDNLYLREYKDLDLLVRSSELERAKTVMAGQGYLLADWLKEAPQKTLNEFHEPQHVTYIRVQSAQDTGVQVELHWGIATSFGAFKADEARLWSRVRQETVGGFTLPALPPDEMLIILLMHGTKHMWGSLHWLYDLAAFVQRYPDFDWGALMAETERRGIKRLTLVSFVTAEKVLGLPLPEAVGQAVDADPVTPLMAGFNVDLLFDPSPLDTPNGQFRFVLYQLLMRESLREQAAYLIYTIRHRRSPATRTLLIEIIGGILLILAVLYVIIFILIH